MIFLFKIIKVHLTPKIFSIRNALTVLCSVIKPTGSKSRKEVEGEIRSE